MNYCIRDISIHPVPFFENSLKSIMMLINIFQGTKKKNTISPVKCTMSECCKEVQLIFIGFQNEIIGTIRHALDQEFCLLDDNFSLSPG